jgi:membrane dipeptidase
MAEIAGPEHVCVGMNYFEYQAGATDDTTADLVYKFLIDSGSWNKKEYPAPPWHYPKGIEMPDTFENLTQGLCDRGYSQAQTKEILGMNILRIFDTVWK